MVCSRKFDFLLARSRCGLKIEGKADVVNCFFPKRFQKEKLSAKRDTIVLGKGKRRFDVVAF